MERLSREIAGVHPFSLRDPFANNATYQGKCIEYIRISAVSAYLGSATASAALSVIENPNDVLQTGNVSALSVARRVSVHSQDATDLYSSTDNNSVKAITAFSALNNTATFSAAFSSDSTGKRYTVLDKNGPVSWCMFNNQLYRYANYNTNYGTAKTVDWFIAQATTGSAYSSLMAEHVSSSSLFKVTAPTLTIWCREDRVIDVSAMDAIRNGLKHAPQIGITELNGCGHMSIMERPREVADAITRFVLMP